MKRIMWEDSSDLRNECGDLLDGVVTVVHGHMMTMSVCAHHEHYPNRTFWVIDIHEVKDYYGPESVDALRAASWEAAVCFENEGEAMLWFTNNVHKRLLMTDAHDADFAVFLKTIPEQRP
ncbi:MAG: hypothetical protein RR740_00645 [Pseudomonas sp.]